MATKTLRVCDVCEAPVTRDPIQFGWGTASYETDLCDEHAEALASLIETAIRSARRIGGVTGVTLAPGSPAAAVSPTVRRRQRVDTATVRAWAKGQGIEVSDKGRVPESLIVQFQEATTRS